MTRRTALLFVCFGLAVLVAARARGAGASGLSGGDEDAVKDVITATTEALNAHDAKAFARHYTADAELVTVRCEILRGAADIERGLAAIFATRARGARLRTLDVTVRFIRPDVAVAHVTNEMTGVTNAQGERMPPQRELSVRVLVKDDGVWRVTAFHNTIVSSASASSSYR